MENLFERIQTPTGEGNGNGAIQSCPEGGRLVHAPPAASIAKTVTRARSLHLIGPTGLSSASLGVQHPSRDEESRVRLPRGSGLVSGHPKRQQVKHPSRLLPATVYSHQGRLPRLARPLRQNRASVL